MRDYINTSIKKIRQAIYNNKLVIFVGAGVSANSKCPSWGELIDRFSDELGIPQSERKKESTEYFLKIPQYYYIERGQKQYFDIINNVFCNPNNIPVPNAINKRIFELNPSIVVTTNFDELLEKTIESDARYYTVIKQDEDLPYSLNDNLIIKMHGDVKLKNIVLKEEDYLNYSNNFPLIENYLKGLFSTKTILFVGYSANDPDFKLMFNWVKEKLNGHFQPAYLLETEKNQERLEFNYYKDRGINILYYKEIQDDIAKLLGESFESSLNDDRGKHLEIFLRYIRDYNEKLSFVKDIYNRLKVFEGLNAIMPKDILMQLNEKYTCFNIEYKSLIFNTHEDKSDYLNEFKEKIEEGLKLESNKNREEFLKKIIQEDKNILRIFDILHKASISEILVGNLGDYKKVEIADYIQFNDDLEKDEFEELLKACDLEKLEKMLHYYLISTPINGNEYLYLRKAYFLYKIGKYLEAYTILRNVSVYCYSSKKYLLWYISLFNMKNLYGKIFEEKYNLAKKYFESNYNEVLNEIKEIDLEKEVNKIPYQYIQEKLKYVSKRISIDVFNQKIQHVQELTGKIKEDKILIERGGTSYNQNIAKLYQEVKDMTNFIHRNYLMVSHLNSISKIFSIFIEGIIVNYSVKKKNSSIEIFGTTPKVEEFDDFDIEMMLLYTINKELISYIDGNNIIELNVNRNGIEYLLTCLDNIVQLNRSEIVKMDNLLNNIITILSYCDLSKQEFEMIIEKFIVLLKKNGLVMLSFENINMFIVRIYKKDKERIELNALILFLKQYLIMYNNNELNGFAREILKSTILFINICYISNEKSMSIDNEITIFISNYLSEIKNRSYENNYVDAEEIIPNLLIPVFNILGDKDNIKKSILDTIEEIVLYFKKLEKFNIYLKIEYYLLFNDMIKINDEEKNRFVENINCSFREKLDCEKKAKYNSNNSSEMYMKMLLNLILAKKINYSSIKEFCKDIKNENNMFSFFVEPDTFDYRKFDAEWIRFISDEAIEELSKNINVANKITPVLLEKLNEENIGKEYKRKIILLIKKVFLIEVK
ncbi:SIR2 family protein [Clostridium sp.]|uniref:SIR2 family protein n=1 Tax=Clostridium sp. TaxID=1506 RepID=UPI00284F9F8B|nr:SIR2 family protein [Clostridium sp.]MDR3594158.1 SIR2 family protein [Clostridium sp.]